MQAPVKVSGCAFVRERSPALGSEWCQDQDRGPGSRAQKLPARGTGRHRRPGGQGTAPWGWEGVGGGEGQAALTPTLDLRCFSGRKKGPPSNTKEAPQRETPHHQREVSGPAGQTAAGGAEAAGGGQEGGVLPPELGQRAGRQHRDLHPRGPDAALGRAAPRSLSRRAPPPSHSRLIPPASPPRLHVCAINTLERPDARAPGHSDFSQTARMPTPGAGAAWGPLTHPSVPRGGRGNRSRWNPVHTLLFIFL